MIEIEYGKYDLDSELIMIFESQILIADKG